MLNNLILKMYTEELNVPLNIHEENSFFSFVVSILVGIRNILEMEQWYINRTLLMVHT